MLYNPAHPDYFRIERARVIIDRYIIREIAMPMFLGCALLIVVFTAYTAAVRLSEASNGLIQPEMVGKLISLSTLISLEVLLPTALYLSIISALGRIYRESEMAALRASGFGETGLLRSVFFFAIAISIVVGVVSIFGRPWAYQEIYRMEAEAIADFDIRNMQPDQFIEFDDGAHVLYTREINQQDGRLSRVFLESDAGEGKTNVIVAASAHLPPVEPGTSRSVEFYDGYAYTLSLTDNKDSVLKFGTLTIHLLEDELQMEHKRKSEPTTHLAKSTDPKDIAEYQWRLSSPVATLLLAMVAVPLSRSAPRQSNHKNFFAAILVYIGFFNLVTMATNWVKEGEVKATPGIWWVYVVGLLVFLLLLLWPVIAMRRQKTLQAGHD